MKKRISALVLAIAMLLSVVPQAAATEADTAVSAPVTSNSSAETERVFSDTEGMYYETAAERWAAVGVVTGVGDDLFAGNNQATRGQAAKIIVETAGFEVKDVPESFYQTFTDVEAGSWQAPYIYTLFLRNIMQGDGVSSMRPDAPITREEYIVLYGRAFGIAENKFALQFSSLKGKENVSEWAAGYMGAFIADGIIQGDENGALNAGDIITRGEMVVVSDRLIGEYITEGGEYNLGGTGIAVIATDEPVNITGTYDGTVIIAETAGQVTVDMSDARAIVAQGGKVIVKGEADMLTVSGTADVSVYENAQITAVQASGKDASLEFNGTAESIAADGANVTVGAYGSADTLSISGEGSNITVVGKVDLIADSKNAKDTVILADIGSSVQQININGNDTEITGFGSVQNVAANGSGITVDTLGTTVAAGEQSEGVTVKGAEVTAGQTVQGTGSVPGVIPPAAETPDPSMAFIISHPVGKETKYYGSAVTLSVDHMNEAGHGYTYQWYMNTTGASFGGAAISGATKPEYTVTTTDASKKGKTLYYYCEITSHLNDKTVSTNTLAAPVTIKNEALNILSFGGHAMSEYHAYNTFIEMLKAQGISVNVINSFLSHNDTANSTFNIYELFANNTVRADLGNYTFGTGSSAVRTENALKNTDLDYIILQTGRDWTLAYNDNATYNNYSIRKIAALASEKSPDAQMILVAPYAHTVGYYEDFGRYTKNPGLDTYFDHVNAINAEAEQAKADVDADGYLNNPVKIAYVSDAFYEYSDDLAKIKADLYRADNGKICSDGGYRGMNTANRANALGAYLMACTIFTTVADMPAAVVEYMGYDAGALDAEGVNGETTALLASLGLTAAEAADMIKSRASGDFTSYTVEHYMQDADLVNYTLDDTLTEEIYVRKDNGIYTAVSKSVNGFHEHAAHPEAYVTDLVAEDGSTVFKIYYDRDSYVVSYEYGNFFNNTKKPAPPAAQSYIWGTAVDIEAAPEWEGYVFSGWTCEDAVVTDGSFTMPMGHITFKGNWSKSGAGNPEPSVGSVQVQGFTNDSLGNSSLSYSAERFTGNLEFVADLTAAGLTADDHNAAVISIGNISANAKVAIVGKLNGETETREFTSTAEGTLDVLWGFEEGETEITIWVYDSDNEIEAELIIATEFDIFQDINIYLFASFAGQASDSMKTLELMLEEKLGTSVELTYPTLGTWNTYNNWELLSISDGVVSGITNSLLKGIFSESSAKEYDSFVFQLSNDYVAFKGRYHTNENAAFVYLQDQIAQYYPGAEFIVYAPYAMRQGYGEANVFWQYRFTPTDFPGLRSEENIYMNSRWNAADIVQMRANVVMDLLEAEESYSSVNTRLAMVCDAFEYYIANEGIEDDLYSTEEGKRASSTLSAYRNLANTNGAYLNAAVLAAALLNESVIDISTLGAEGHAVSENDAQLLLAIADIFGLGISPATAEQLTFDLTSVAADGTEKPVTVTGTDGMGEITVYYNGSITAPKVPGTYTVTADIAPGTIYGYAKGVVLGEYTLTGDGLGATVALTPNVLNAGLTGGNAIYAGETMTLDGTLRYNGKANGHTVDLTVTGPKGAYVIGQSDAGLTAAEIGEQGIALISVPVTPEKDTVKVTVSGEAAVDTFTIKIADTAKLTVNVLLIGDNYVNAANMNAHKWLRDVLTNAGYTPDINAQFVGGNMLMTEMISVTNGEFALSTSSYFTSLHQPALSTFTALDTNGTYNSVDYSTYKYDYCVVSVNRRGATTSTTTYNNELNVIKRLETMMYNHNPDAEMILLASTGSNYSGDSSYGSAAEQVAKASANADKIKTALESSGEDLDIKILRFGEAVAVAAADATSMASNSTSSWSLQVNNYSDTNKRNMGPLGAAMMYYMFANYMVDIDIIEVAYPTGFKNAEETANSWSVGGDGLPIAQYWANVLTDEYFID